MQQRPPSLRSTTFPIVRPYRKRLPQQPNNPSGRAHTESHQPNRVQIPIETVAPPPPTSRDFVPWRFSDACRPARRCIRHPGIRETLYGALEVKQNNSGHVIFLQPNFFARLESPFLHPDPATSKRCRAQGLSRLAAAQISPHAPAMPGHTLTAPSTAARSLWSG
jgi:hypothetical protein